jgi:FkbM family methyltransferase
MSTISYAQNFEDVMLLRALADVGEGFYVDVGAQHPINGSVTKAFHLRGWRGINIEPVDRWFRLLCEDRPNDINLRIPISDAPGYLDLFDVEDTGLSTVRQDYAETYTEDGWNVVKHRLKAHTLSAVLRAHAPKDIHFLKVDVEGAEAAVLRSLDFNRFRPWIVLVEATKPNSPEPVFAEWEPLLLDAGYLFAYDDGLNRYYVATEQKDRIKYFSKPPNFFDDFMLYSESWARSQMDRLANEVEFERNQMQRVSDDYQVAAAKVERLESNRDEILAGVDYRIAMLDAHISEQLESLNQRISEHLGSLDQRVSARLGSLDQRVSEQQGSLGARLETAVERINERLAFADNVQATLLDTLNRERSMDAKLQQILRSRSWRLTKGPRFIARSLRRLLRRSGAPDSVRDEQLKTRLLMAAVNQSALRRLGAFFLSATPGLKAELVRVVVSNAKPSVPAPASSSGALEGVHAHLPARARTVRAMLDSAMKSSDIYG